MSASSPPRAGAPLPAAAAAAWLALAGSCGLILLGGLVTTHDAGMAVPDWPLSFGAVNPPGWWDLFEVRLEHSHRLAGAGVGMLTILMTVAVFLSTRAPAPKQDVFGAGPSAPPRPGAARERRGLRLAALGLLALVIIQGVLGGLRVIGASLPLAIVHAVTAQIFFALLFLFAARLTLGCPGPRAEGGPPGGALAFGLLTLPLLLLAQLVVAAVMRHHKAGMAIVDFPLHFGRLIPPLDTFPIAVHFAHRALGWLIALVILAALASALVTPSGRAVRPWLWAMLGLVALQIALGARIVTGGRPPAEISAHLLVAAFLLALGVTVAYRHLRPPPLPAARPPAPSPAGGLPL